MTKKCHVKHIVFGDIFHYFDFHLDGVLRRILGNVLYFSTKKHTF